MNSDIVDRYKLQFARAIRALEARRDDLSRTITSVSYTNASQETLHNLTEKRNTLEEIIHFLKLMYQEV